MPYQVNPSITPSQIKHCNYLSENGLLVSQRIKTEIFKANHKQCWIIHTLLTSHLW